MDLFVSFYPGSSTNSKAPPPTTYRKHTETHEPVSATGTQIRHEVLIAGARQQRFNPAKAMSIATNSPRLSVIGSGTTVRFNVQLSRYA